jgi:hypothetical protein
MKLTRKQKINLIEARLELSMLKFHMSLPWIVRKLFSDQALTWYAKGKDDSLADFMWLKKKILKMERTSCKKSITKNI